jgi:hypothetical protein
MPTVFVENRGQLDDRVRFAARHRGMDAYFTRESFVLQLVQRDARDPDALIAASLALEFEGVASEPVVEGLEPLPGRYNYFLGNDPAAWHTSVPTYARIRYRAIYPGVDIEVHEQESGLEYDLVLSPEAELRRVVLRCVGADAISIDESGALVLETRAGCVKQPRPRTYQLGPTGDREPIECSYRLLGADCIGFDVPFRDPARSLVIDPGLVYATYLGGSDVETTVAIAVDDLGSAYVTGVTLSHDFPTTPGAYDTTHNGGSINWPQDAFVAKLNADGSGLDYATFLGRQPERRRGAPASRSTTPVRPSSRE